MEYSKVPEILTGKDLTYLSDIFMWNYNAFKKFYNFTENIEDKKVKSIIEDAVDSFYNNMLDVLEIMEVALDE